MVRTSSESRATVAVVGLGTAGILVARTLADACHAVLAFQPTPAEGARSGLASPAPTVRARPDQLAALADRPPAGADRIGGSKILAAPQSYRLGDDVFHFASRSRARYGPAAIPADADLHDWPVDSTDLDPFYDRIERRMRVAPRPGTAWTRRMADAATASGLTPFAAPAAAEADRAPHAAHDAVTIVPSTVTTILLSSTGAACGVEYLDETGRTARRSCAAVVIACAVVPAIRLLLLSGISDGGVGSGFAAHNAFVVHGWFPGVDLGRDAAGPATAVAASDVESDRFDHTGLGFLGGSLIQAAMTGPRTDAWAAGVASGLPIRTADPHAWVSAHAGSIGSVWAQPDQLPRTHHRVDLDPTHTDRSGRAVARLTLGLSADDERRARFLAERMSAWLERAGAATTWRAPLTAQPLGTHLYGGIRMGSDPAVSVVDGWGRSHRVPGLVVVGSSTFPTTGGRGPVQTVEALALRAAEKLADDLR